MTETNPAGLGDNAAGALPTSPSSRRSCSWFSRPITRIHYVRFHAWQSIFLNVAAIVLGIAFSFLTVFGWMFGMVFLLSPHPADLAWMVHGLVGVPAEGGEWAALQAPGIGDLAEKQAGS